MRRAFKGLAMESLIPMEVASSKEMEKPKIIWEKQRKYIRIFFVVILVVVLSVATSVISLRHSKKLDESDPTYWADYQLSVDLFIYF